MKKFRKKPVVVEAVQWNGTEGSYHEVIRLASSGNRKVVLNATDNELIIPTLEGNMTASFGDWIIKGVSGEVYPCKPDIFEKTYEEVE